MKRYKYRKYNNDALKKMIITTFLGVILIVGSLVVVGQQRQINQLNEDLYLKQIVDERATDETISMANVKTIQEKFNELQTYSVLKNSKVSQTHTYMYEQDSFLGLKRKATLKGTANLVYNYDVSFADAEISQNKKGDTITITIGTPTLDIDSIHIEKNSLVIEEEDYNILCNENDGETVMRYFYETFVERGIFNIEDMYSTADKKEQLDRIAIEEISKLIETLNLNNCNVIVKIGE